MKETFETYEDAKVQDYSTHSDVNEYLGNILGESFREYRAKWDKATQLEKVYDFPLFMVLEPMFKCNLKCIMCLHSNQENASVKYDGKMPWDMYVRIIEEASRYNCPSLAIGGMCEPILDTRLSEMVAVAKKCGFVDIMLNTNATLLKREVSKKLIENGLTRLRIGFDGATAGTYEKIRIGAGFEKVKSNIMGFINLRNEMNSEVPIIRISCVHLSANDQEIEEFIKFWSPIVDYVSIQRYRPHEFTEKRTRKKLGAGVKAIENLKCSEAWERVYIRGNGDVHICGLPAYSPKIGNLRENTIYEMWNSEFMNNIRNAIKCGDWESIPTCKECMLQYFYSA